MMDGQWSFALEPYYEVNVTAELYSNRAQELFAIEDVFQIFDTIIGSFLIYLRGDGHYYVEMENVEDEWVGFYMFVTPDTFPAPLCTEDPDCYGNLV
ncbi:hypothetical protein LSH36_1626g00007 [Paralvinella palmiformis]|uniref:Uncharacterized protein n=1 Tax=Paralvinella palmiformis TaxID=53620 RepID=A0AAD9ISE1_9ANNE|nr:hypothetical protein LSH36_1626g00007 [Paralvinella palmiformis]